MLTEWTRAGDRIEGKRRVAAFLPSESEGAEGKKFDMASAVALYDYQIAMTRPGEDDEAWLQLPRRV